MSKSALFGLFSGLSAMISFWIGYYFGYQNGKRVGREEEARGWFDDSPP